MKFFNPEVLRERLRRHDLSYKVFSEQCGISYYSLKRILAGECSPPPELVDKFAAFFDWHPNLFYVVVPDTVISLIRNEVLQ